MSSDSELPTLHQILVPGIAKISGPMLLAASINWGLYGVLIVQIYVYFVAFPSDRLSMRCTVFGLFLLETTQSVLVLIDTVRVGTGIDRLLTLDEVGELWLSIPLLTGLVTLICHGIYAYRIWILSTEYKYLKRTTWLIGGICLIQFSSSVVLGIVTKLVGRLSIVQDSLVFRVTTKIWFLSGAAGDAIIAACMIYLTTNKDINVEKIRRYLQKVVRLTIGTGAMTAAITMITFILILLPGNLTYYQVSVASLAKLYSISLVVLLNSRMKIQSTDPSQDTLYWTSLDEGLSTIEFSDAFQDFNKTQYSLERDV